jgi:lysyl-tRNA synthetase class 2
MLEWYRVGEAYESVMADCVEMIRIAARVTGATELRSKGKTADPFAEPERLSVAEAFARYAGVDLLATIGSSGPDDGALAEAVAGAGMSVPPDFTWSYLFTRVLTERVEPNLGIGRVTILDRYPASEAALARKTADDARLAERFEIYACGVELANGFGELIDPGMQRQNLTREMNEKERLYGERYPIDEEFLAALAIMPEASGVALGFDRLVMLATGAPKIEDVLWVPVG